LAHEQAKVWAGPRPLSPGAVRGEEVWLAEEALSEAYGEGTVSWLSPGIEAIEELQCQVLSWSGDWSWAISLLQLGVRGLPCFAFGEPARRSLLIVAEALPQLAVRPVGAALVPGAMTFSHIGKIVDLEQLVGVLSEYGADLGRGMVSFPWKWRRAGFKEVCKAFGRGPGAPGLRKYARPSGVGRGRSRKHTGPSRGAESRLHGGLTSGAFAIAWWGFDAPARHGVDLGRVPRARREPVVFLEPLAKLTVWRRLEAVEQTTEDGATRLRVRLGGDGASGAPLGPYCWAASWPHPGNGVGTRPHGVHGGHLDSAAVVLKGKGPDSRHSRGLGGPVGGPLLAARGRRLPTLSDTHGSPYPSPSGHACRSC
jgi:hypothetical protein